MTEIMIAFVSIAIGVPMLFFIGLIWVAMIDIIKSEVARRKRNNEYLKQNAERQRESLERFESVRRVYEKDRHGMV